MRNRCETCDTKKNTTPSSVLRKHGQRTVVGACGQRPEYACTIYVVYSPSCCSSCTLTPTYADLLQAVSVGFPLITSSILGRNIQNDVKNWYACLYMHMPHSTLDACPTEWLLYAAARLAQISNKTSATGLQHVYAVFAQAACLPILTFTIFNLVRPSSNTSASVGTNTSDNQAGSRRE